MCLQKHFSFIVCEIQDVFDIWCAFIGCLTMHNYVYDIWCAFLGCFTMHNDACDIWCAFIGCFTMHNVNLSGYVICCNG